MAIWTYQSSDASRRRARQPAACGRLYAAVAVPLMLATAAATPAAAPAAEHLPPWVIFDFRQIHANLGSIRELATGLGPKQYGVYGATASHGTVCVDLTRDPTKVRFRAPFVYCMYAWRLRQFGFQPTIASFRSSWIAGGLRDPHVVRIVVTLPGHRARDATLFPGGYFLQLPWHWAGRGTVTLRAIRANGSQHTARIPIKPPPKPPTG